MSDKEYFSMSSFGGSPGSGINRIKEEAKLMGPDAVSLTPEEFDTWWAESIERIIGNLKTLKDDVLAKPLEDMSIEELAAIVKQVNGIIEDAEGVKHEVEEKIHEKENPKEPS